MFLLKNNEFSFISHDSILKLNDIRSISINRILYQHKGQIPPDSTTYKQIESLVIQKYFPGFYYDFNQNMQRLTILNEEISELKEKNSILSSENENLKTEIIELKSKLTVD